MFVQSVTKQTGKIRIKNQGWVKTQGSIDKLIKAGILEISIDPDKTLTLDSDNKVVEQQDIAKPATNSETFNPWHTSHSVSAEMSKANSLYNEARTLQSKAFDDIRDGNKIDIAPFKDLASGFIDSVFRNQDAYEKPNQ